MTRQEAIEVYLKDYVSAAKTIKKIMAWDESLTIKANAEKTNVHVQVASQLKRKYDLKSVNERGNNQLYISQNRKNIPKLRRMGFTDSAIARLFQVSKQCVNQSAKKK